MPQRCSPGWRLALILLLHTAGLGPSLAQTPRTHAEPAPTPSLLANATYWRLHGDRRAALAELRRILGYAPDNADVLAAAAELSFELDDFATGAAYRTALARAAPHDPRLPSLVAEHQRTPQDSALLAEARRLAHDGNNTDAVARYQALFHGPVPGSLALEYYDALGSSTPEGIAAAQAQLARLVEATPGDGRLQLAYAKLLSRQEETRNEAIRRLAALSRQPDIGRTATESWREVLLWQGPSEKARSQIVAYLEANPADQELQARLRSFDEVLPDASARATMHGYYEAATDPAKAEADFQAALRANPNNADAMVMIAGLRRSQGRPAEAQLLIDQAVAIAPDRRAELVQAAGGDFPGLLPLNVVEQVEIARLTDAGAYEHAERLLKRLYQGREQSSTYVQLGTIQLREGHLDDAERSLRQARAMDPRSGEAACALADVLGRRGDFDGAEALLTEAAGLYARSRTEAGARRIAVSRAGLVDDRAAGLPPADAVAVYQAGLAAAPGNIAIRVSLAGALQATGDGAQATAIMAAGVALARGDRQALQAATAAAADLAAEQRIAAEIRTARVAALRQAFAPANPP